jgi:hypothetical protein
MNGVFVTRLEALLNATARVQSVVDCFSWPDDFRVVLRQEWMSRSGAPQIKS